MENFDFSSESEKQEKKKKKVFSQNAIFQGKIAIFSRVSIFHRNELFCLKQNFHPKMTVT